MAEQFPPCPRCESEFTYESGLLLACPMCQHEWDPSAPAEAPDVAPAEAFGMLALDLGPGDPLVEVAELLLRGSDDGRWEFEAARLSPAWEAATPDW